MAAGRGRSASITLMRHAISHLAITGGMAASDGVIQQVLGHGIAAKLSQRLGEGMLNGLLTAPPGSRRHRCDAAIAIHGAARRSLASREGICCGSENGGRVFCSD